MLTSLAVAAALAALFAVFLLTVRAEQPTPIRLLAAVFALLCGQLLLSVAQVTGHSAVAFLKPVLAMGFAPLLFLQLEAAARPEASLRRTDAVHLAGPVLMAVALAAGSGAVVDLLGAAGVALYLGLILWRTRGGADRFAARGPAAARSLALWRIAVAMTLAFMLVADAAVTIDVNRSGELAGSIAFWGFSLILCFLLASGILAILHRQGPMQWLFGLNRRPEPDLEETFRRLQQHMDSRRPWTEPDLSVSRLGRQLGLPQRAVSGAVNRFAGCSFSRWVNGYRVREVMAKLRERPDGPLLDMMMDAGFQTKSNFNRAFRDETGMSPSQWRQGAAEQA